MQLHEVYRIRKKRLFNRGVLCAPFSRLGALRFRFAHPRKTRGYTAPDLAGLPPKLPLLQKCLYSPTSHTREPLYGIENG